MKLLMYAAMFFLLAGPAQAQTRPFVMAPNLVICESDTNIELELKNEQLTISRTDFSSGASLDLSQTSKTLTAMGTVYSAFWRSIQDMNVSYSLVFPTVFLTGTSDVVDFSTKLVITRSNGMPLPNGVIGAGVAKRNEYQNLDCKASYVQPGQTEVFEDAIEVVKARGWVNVMPSPGPRPDRSIVGLVLETKVLSTGCTDPSDFKTKLVRVSSDTYAISVERAQPDLCRARTRVVTLELPIGQFRVGSSLTYKGSEVPVELQFAH